ncbi:MAG: CAP domain-containing protein [Alphaproteobacteria bacterium]|nr:CAP domain-containing protein [Alphaproteobacteria bacterium]
MSGALVMCTTLGPLVASTDGGRISGTIGAARAEGTEGWLQVTHGGVRLWEGPLSGLEPTPPPPDTSSIALTHAAAAGLPSCEATRIRVGAWSEPVDVPEGSRVVWRTPSDLLLRSEEGVTHLVSVPADRALAEALAVETSGVWWKDGWLLAADGPFVPSSMERVAPGEPIPGLAVLMGLTPMPRTTVPVAPPWRDGAEVAAMVDEVRANAGLDPIPWDQGLAEAALQHAAYLALHDPDPHTHRQDPDDAWFVGTYPEERGGAWEILLRLGSATPEEVLAQWLAAPFHRLPLIRPGATGIGVAHVGRSWVAEIRVDTSVGPTGGWPGRGEVVPTGRFEGHEQPDPLPRWQHPDVSWPTGWPITVWDAPKTLEAVVSCDGARLPFYVADAALGTPREAVHLIPRSPLAPGATCAWNASWSALGEPDAATAPRKAPVPSTVTRRVSGTFRVAPVPTAVTGLPGGLDAVLTEVNAQRAAFGRPPLTPTAQSAARARLLSARTRAMKEGLSPSRVPGVAGGEPDDPRPVQLCTRPEEPFEIDESWLDPSLATIGADDRAVVLTWIGGRGGTTSSLASPRTCVWLFPASDRGQP